MNSIVNEKIILGVNSDLITLAHLVITKDRKLHIEVSNVKAVKLDDEVLEGYISNYVDSLDINRKMGLMDNLNCPPSKLIDSILRDSRGDIRDKALSKVIYKGLKFTDVFNSTYIIEYLTNFELNLDIYDYNTSYFSDSGFFIFKDALSKHNTKLTNEDICSLMSHILKIKEEDNFNDLAMGLKGVLEQYFKVSLY